MSRSFIFTSLISYSTVRSPSKLLYNMLLNRSIHTLLFIWIISFLSLFLFLATPRQESDLSYSWNRHCSCSNARSLINPIRPVRHGTYVSVPQRHCWTHCATSRSSWIIFVEEIFTCGITEQNSVNIFGFICTLKLDLCPTCYAVFNGRLYLLLSYFIKCHLLI